MRFSEENRLKLLPLRTFLAIHLLGLAMLLPLAARCRAAGQPEAAHDFEIKAGLLNTFARHTTWPTNCFATTNSPIVIGLFGGEELDPLARFLEEMARARKSQRPLQIQRLRGVAEAPDCHIIFISQAQSRNEPKLFAALKGKPVLTVGETPETIERGGMISLALVAGRIRHEINVRAVTEGRLGLSAHMYSHARRLHHLAGTP